MLDRQKPLFVQRDLSLLLETGKPETEQAARAIGRFADLVKTPEGIHTYRMTPLSLWNAAAAGITGDDVTAALARYSKHPIPEQVRESVARYVARYGLLRLERDAGLLVLRSGDAALLARLAEDPRLRHAFTWPQEDGLLTVRPESRGILKRELIRLGYPVVDAAGFHEGERLPIRVRDEIKPGRPFRLRAYQLDAVDAFFGTNGADGGSGVLVLPCGAGKTVIGIAVMARLGCATLILAPNVVSVRQWISELLEKTDISPEHVGEYNGTAKQVRPVTVATYQMLTHRRTKEDEFRHMKLFTERDWGLIVYDEVHLLPAPVFRVTAGIQATRRLGLTATLIREDGCAEDVFSLVGPKRFDMPWRQLELDGDLAQVTCTEVRVSFAEGVREQYGNAERRQQPRIAAENPAKLDVVQRLLRKHTGEPTLIIGHYVEQLRRIAKACGAPVISGETPHDERNRLYDGFKRGEVPTLVVSKVANVAVDLPNAAVAIQVSGSYGSRQEEAQRLGRILRPKANAREAFFYTLVTRDTKEQQFALHRQLFLVERGYRYGVADADGWPEEEGGAT